MRILVASASKHGATAEIATRIGNTLRGEGFECEVRDVCDVPDPSGFQAVVLGSGVYAGQWLKDARKFIDKNAAALQTMPVWVFSSGPLGDPLKPDDEEAVTAAGVVEATAAIEHRLFAGALDKSKLSFGEKAIVKAVRAADGDFRDWAAIDAWAEQIAVALRDR
jgi:menaquinone-dependent protoporphyrinogen oxidase